MRMKRVLLASSALTLLAAMGQAQAKDLYVSVFGGANWLTDSSGTFTDETETHIWSAEPDTGFVIGGAIGTHLDNWVRGLRTEVEVSYRRNNLGGGWFESEERTTEGGPLTGNMSTFAIMANLWYDIDVGQKFVPYIGGGAGWARMHGEMAALRTFSNLGTPSGSTDTSTVVDNSGFAYQVGAGLNYEVMPDVDLGIGYRYFVGPRFDHFFEGKGTLENHNHAVMVNLTVDID
jgi:opacity protein-like surface antigen